MLNNKNDKKENYTIETENLAIPEVHTGKVDIEDTDKEDNKKSSVTYDTLAVPEVHIRKKK